MSQIEISRRFFLQLSGAAMLGPDTPTGPDGKGSLFHLYLSLLSRGTELATTPDQEAIACLNDFYARHKLEAPHIGNTQLFVGEQGAEFSRVFCEILAPGGPFDILVESAGTTDILERPNAFWFITTDSPGGTTSKEGGVTKIAVNPTSERQLSTFAHEMFHGFVDISKVEESFTATHKNTEVDMAQPMRETLAFLFEYAVGANYTTIPEEQFQIMVRKLNNRGGFNALIGGAQLPNYYSAEALNLLIQDGPPEEDLFVLLAQYLGTDLAVRILVNLTPEEILRSLGEYLTDPEGTDNELSRVIADQQAYGYITEYNTYPDVKLNLPSGFAGMSTGGEAWSDLYGDGKLYLVARTFGFELDGNETRQEGVLFDVLAGYYDEGGKFILIENNKIKYGRLEGSRRQSVFLEDTQQKIPVGTTIFLQPKFRKPNGEIYLLSYFLPFTTDAETARNKPAAANEILVMWDALPKDVQNAIGPEEFIRQMSTPALSPSR